VKTGTITVSNVGNRALTLTTPTPGTLTQPSPPRFQILTAGTTCTAGAIIAANGGTCTISVQYTPPATGTTPGGTATVSLTDTGAATTTQVLLISGN